MGMVDKVRGRDGRRMISAVEMWYNRDSGDRYTGIWIGWHRRRGTGDRRDAGRWIYLFLGRSIGMGVYE